MNNTKLLLLNKLLETKRKASTDLSEYDKKWNGWVGDGVRNGRGNISSVIRECNVQINKLTKERVDEVE